MKLNKLGKFAALCMAGCMLLGGCGAENPADEKTVTGNAADVSAEKSETRMDSENNTTVLPTHFRHSTQPIQAATSYGTHHRSVL